MAHQVAARFGMHVHAPMMLLIAAGPFVGMAVLFAPLPKAVLGVCSNCGYDLRATPDRCPECGRPASPPL